MWGWCTAREFRLEVLVKRRFWLILTMAILFGIEAPLCAFACVEAGAPQLATHDSEPVSEATPHLDPTHQRSAPCHGSKPDSAPADVPESHQDCGCDFTVEGLLSDSSSTATISVIGWTSPDGLIDFIAADNREAWKASFESDIPPPDLLLLKSTLLI